MIFVTGARGFVGAELVIKLAKEGHKVRALTRPGSKLREDIIKYPNVEMINGDVANYGDMRNLTKGCNEGYHLAAFAKPWARNNDTFYDINVTGTINVLRAAKENGASKVVVTSSAGTFGPQNGAELITESIDQKLPHFTEYEKTKNESVIKAKGLIDAQFSVCFVSPTRVFGPGELSVSNAVTRIFKKYMDEGFRFMPGDGKTVGNYAYINDVVNGHILAMDKGLSGENYILGGENLSYREFFEEIGLATHQKRSMIGVPVGIMLFASYLMKMIADLTGKEPTITPPFIRKYLHNWGTDLSKSKNEIGYSVTPFRDALQETIAWIRQNE